MQEYNFEVNGQSVIAQYDQDDIENVFKPLLERWYRLYKEKNQRIIVGIAACPGSGKSTFVLFLEYLFKEMNRDCELQSVGMDGFHYYNSYLDFHDLRKEKGSKNTFDVKKLKEKIIQTKKENCYWPVYSRKVHDPIENMVYVDGDIILVEGNYLLSKDAPWNELLDLFDDTLFIHVPKEELRNRLIQRKVKGNLPMDLAVDFYNKSDSVNVEYVLNSHIKANSELYFVLNKVSK